MNRNPGSDTVQDEDQTSFDPISRNGKPWGLFESFAGCAHEPLPVTLTISDKQRPLKDSKQKTQKQPKKKGPPASSTARVKRISSLYFGLSMAKEHEGSSSQRTRGLSSSSKQPTITASRTAPPSSTQRGASLGQIVCHSKQDPDEQEALLLAKQQFEILRRPIAPPLTSYLNPYHYFEEGPDASEASDQEPLSSASHSSLSSPSSLRAIDSAAATDAYGLKTTDTNTAYVLVTSSSCSSSLSLSLSPSVSTPIGPSLSASELCLPPSDGPAHKVRSRLASEVGMLDLEDTGDDGGDGDSQSHEGDDDCNDRDEDGSGDDGDPRGDGAEQQGQRSPLIFSASPPRGYDAPEGISLTLPPGLSPVPDPSPEAATEGGYDLLEEIDSLAMVRKGDQADNALWRAGDWNHRFQELITMIQRSTITDLHRPRLYQELLTLSHDFINTAKIYGRIIISERFLPVRPLSETETGTGKGCLAQYKTINPIIMGGVCGGEKYIVSNILFKFAVDQHRILGSDHAAAKVAGHELVGHTAYFNLCLPGLHLPLMALVDYMGFRLTAMSLLPVTRQTLVYGSANGGQTVFATLPGYNALMAQAGRRLALAPHLCGMDEEHSVSLWAAADIEGHLGTDGRFYLLDLSRTMPPMDMRLSPDHPQAFLYRHLRPELVASFSHEVEGRALCPDTYSGFIRHDPKFNEYIEDVRDATKFLLENVIPNTAKELKWVVLEAISQKRVETVNCSEILRRSGVNLRLMGHVLRLSDQPVVRMLILVEVVARVLKNELRHLLRRKMQAVKLTLVEPYRDLVVGFLNHVFYNVQSRSASSVHYWDHILVAECRRAFHVQSFALSDQDEAAISFDPDAGPLEPPVPKLLSLDKESYGDMSQLRPPRGWLSPRMLLPLQVEGFGQTFRSLLIHRLAGLAGLRLTPYSAEAVQCLEPFASIHFESFDVTVKHMPIITNAESHHLLNVACSTGNQQHSLSLLEGAARSYERALLHSPNDWESLIRCAECWYRILIKKRYGDKPSNLAVIDPRDSLTAHVEQFYFRALSVVPDNAYVRLSYARFLTRCGPDRMQKAENQYLRALQIDSNYFDCLVAYAIFLREHSHSEPLADAFDTRASFVRRIQNATPRGDSSSADPDLQSNWLAYLLRYESSKADPTTGI